jgi:hypothetical protein
MYRARNNDDAFGVLKEITSIKIRDMKREGTLRKVVNHLGPIAAGERSQRRIEPQEPAANQPARIHPI